MFEHPLPKEKLESILTQLRLGLESLLGDKLEAIYLYGSRARGDARPDSDIDILIVMKEDFDFNDLFDRTSDLTAGLSLENDIVITRVFVTKRQFENEMSPFMMNVRREGIPV